MPAFKRTRLNDVSFTMDGNLNVLEANRSFASLFDVTDINICLDRFMDITDAQNLKSFLSNLKPGATKIFFTPLFDNECREDFNFETTCTAEDRYTVRLHAFLFAKECFETTVRENNELKAILKTLDRYYFVYDGTQFNIKYSKEQKSVFRGSAEEFKNYITNNFNLDLTESVTQLQMTAMIFNIQKFKTKKEYKFLMTNKKVVTITPEVCGCEGHPAVIGIIYTEEILLDGENLYTKNKDGLTDMFNKQSITEQAIHKVNVLKEPCALIILDIDKFKDYNDTFGHAYGDKVIVAVAKVIKDAVKDLGVAGRIGGDEFMVILNTNDEADIRNVTRNIRMGINWAITNPDASTVVTCSMGISRSPLNTRSYEELFKLADKCLYIAKNKGRNCYVIYKPEIHDSVIIKNEEAQAIKSSGKSYSDDADEQIKIVKMVYALAQKRDAGKASKEELCGDLQLILDELRSYMEVTQLSLYKLNDKDKLLPFLVSGDKKDFRRDYFNEDYFRYYNSYNFLHLDNTTNLNTVDREIYHMYVDNDVASVLEYVNRNEDGKAVAQMSFDIYKPARTFTKEKVVFALTMTKVLTNIL